ncbi:hypothetical protein BJ912DRAFT_963301, partial [Pholiota molesta]
TCITQLEHPTIEEMTQLASEASSQVSVPLLYFKLLRRHSAIMNRSMTAGLFRLIFRAAALEGKLYICQAVDSGKIVSLGAGLDLASRGTKSLGFEEFFNKLPEDTKNWWMENLLKPKPKPVNEKVRQSLRLIAVATLGEERRKGHGSSLIKEIARTVGTPVCVNVNTDDNILFYKGLGFKITGTSEMASSYGSWVGTIMIWEDSGSE